MQKVPHSSVDTGRDCHFTVAGTHYIAVHKNHVLFPSMKQDFTLATVFAVPSTHKPEVSAKWVQEKVLEYLRHDDIFHEDFLATVLFHRSPGDDIEITDEVYDFLRSHGAQQIIQSSVPQLLPGPYALVGQQLRDVWKVVDDLNGTCMVTLKPQQKTTDDYEAFQTRSSDSRFSSFAIPSRVKSRAVSTSVLAGLRILVKDNIHLKGIKTSVGNRAFHETYHPQPESAECLEKLIAQGAVILGKTKMNSFATWEEPTQYIDYQAPWNPRADHYQSPGGSSSGSAAAVSTYDWLDIAIGTDTWGSVTRPALWCGCYGLRPSLGAVPAGGIEPYCQVFDTAGILGRDLQKCRDFAAEWLRPDALQKDNKPFSQVIWPVDFWKVISPEQTAIGRDFAHQAVAHLRADYQEISFEELWLQSPPEDAQGADLSEYVDWAANTQSYDAYHNYDDFRAEYQKLTGHAPYVSPPNQKSWAYAQTISKEYRDRGFKNIGTYKMWFENTILAPASGNTLVIMPLENVIPRYRDEPPEFKRPPPGVNSLALPAVLNAPAFAVPIASIPFHSRITQCEEKLPFAVAIMSNPGTDLALMDTVQDVLRAARLPTTVNCGKTMF